ncbi:MAG: HprK-related kinase A [Vicinamibacterales bacterium]
MNEESGHALHALSSDGVQLEIGSVLVRIRSSLPGVSEHLKRFYTGFSIRPLPFGHYDVSIVGTPGLRRFIRPQATLVANSRVPFLPLPSALAGPLMEWGINWCFGQCGQTSLAVHAAVVERAGRTMIMPAQSGSGKSTLCAALVYSGQWRLFSDEFALIDTRTAALSPSPRPISLKERAVDIIKARYPDVVVGPEGRDVEKQRFVHAKPPATSVARAKETAPPGWVVFPKYVPGARTTIERVARAQALVRLADESFNYNQFGRVGYDRLVDIVRASDCYSLEYSDLDDLLPRLAALTAA